MSIGKSINIYSGTTHRTALPALYAGESQWVPYTVSIRRVEQFPPSITGIGWKGEGLKYTYRRMFLQTLSLPLRDSRFG